MFRQFLVIALVASSVIASPLPDSFCPMMDLNEVPLLPSGANITVDGLVASTCQYGSTTCNYLQSTGDFVGSSDDSTNCPLIVRLGTGATEGLNGCPAMSLLNAPLTQATGVSTVSCFYLNQAKPCVYDTDKHPQGGPEICPSFV
ncbi:hypothetical protein DFH06DRAFT_661426 [Mycena polygramma]|nr:hypothetical protein DFH06DRAFT_661426 [Mycena polygramma]